MALGPIDKNRALQIFHDVFPQGVVDVHRITPAKCLKAFPVHLDLSIPDGDWIIVFRCKNEMLRTGGSSHIATVTHLSGKLRYLGLISDSAE
jgi:hypothetical protein